MTDPSTFMHGNAAPTEMHRLIAAADWRHFSAGPPDAWPPSLRAIVDLVLMSKFPMWIIWGPDLIGIYNDAFIPILGSRHPAALCAHWPHVWSEAWPQIEPIVQDALANKPSYFEDLPIPLVRDGWQQLTHFTFSYSPLTGESGRTEGMLCVCSETTKTVEMREANRSQNENLTALFQQAPGFMATFRGPDHIIEMRNDAYMALVGDREVLGKPLALAIPEVVEQGFIQLLDTVFSSGVPYSGRSVRYDAARRLDDDKDEVYVDLVFQPIFNASQEVTGIFLQGSDVTEQYLARKALLEANRHKDQFIAILAHELRNPLAPIRMAARLLEAPGIAPATLASTTQIIGRQVEHMARLLDDLLDVARIARNQMRLQKAYVKADVLISTAVESAREMIEAKQRRVQIVHLDGDIELEADPVRMTQVIANLVCNAAKYTDAGGEIVIESRLDAGQCIVAVRDNGGGIEKLALDKVFNMFAQEAHALARSQGGLGIGLGLVKGLVELHDGTVEAACDGLGRGSTFTVSVPNARALRDVVTTDAGGKLTAGGAVKRILIADDNLDLLDILASFLEIPGHQVISATDGTTAIECACREHPDIAILDIGMPGMNGYEVARAIRQETWGRDMLLVAATGWGSEDDKLAARTAGFDFHLTKPYAMPRLEQILMDHGRSTG